MIILSLAYLKNLQIGPQLLNQWPIFRLCGLRVLLTWSSYWRELMDSESYSEMEFCKSSFTMSGIFAINSWKDMLVAIVVN